MNVSFFVNDDILLTLKENAQDFTRDIRFFSALTWYRRNKLPLGKAAELAGYSKLDFIERMKLENEPVFDYSEEEISSYAKLLLRCLRFAHSKSTNLDHILQVIDLN